MSDWQRMTLVEAALNEELTDGEASGGATRFELPVCPVPRDPWGLQAGLTWDELPRLDDDRGTAPW